MSIPIDRRSAVFFLLITLAAPCTLAQAQRSEPASADGNEAYRTAPVLHVAELGTCTTLAGDTVHDCRVAYRTFGRLNPSKDNAVMIPTWYGGTSERLVQLLGDGAMVDTTQFFAVLVDALGGGVSSSPSTSSVQPGAAFPALTIADMVIAQHRLVKEHLGLPSLHAVAGFSMGAMQALEWATRFPAEVRRVVSLSGTPQPAAHDVVTLRTLRTLVDLARSRGSDRDSSWIPVVEYWHVVRATPDRVNETAPEHLDRALIAQTAYWRAFDIDDNRLQLDAMLRHDVAAPFGGDLAAAAAAVTAELLVVVSPDDRLVGAGPALEFAELAGAQVLTAPSACGHFAIYCEKAISERVRAFLAAGAPRGQAAGY